MLGIDPSAGEAGAHAVMSHGRMSQMPFTPAAAAISETTDHSSAAAQKSRYAFSSRDGITFHTHTHTPPLTPAAARASTTDHSSVIISSTHHLRGWGGRSEFRSGPASGADAMGCRNTMRAIRGLRKRGGRQLESCVR